MKNQEQLNDVDEMINAYRLNCAKTLKSKQISQRPVKNILNVSVVPVSERFVYAHQL